MFLALEKRKVFQTKKFLPGMPHGEGEKSLSTNLLSFPREKFFAGSGNEKREPEKTGSLWGNLIWSG